MLYSRGHAFIYSQLNRTGSSSTALYLRQFCGPDFTPTTPWTPEIISNDGVVGRVGAREAFSVEPRFQVHMALDAIHAGVGADIWDRCAIVSNMRNPYTRTMSIRNVWERQSRIEASEDANVVRSQVDAMDLEGMGERTRELTHLDGQYALTHVLFTETLESDITALAADRGFTAPPPSRPRLQANDNALKSRHPSEFISSDTRRRIEAAYGWIFDRYGYSRHPDDALLPPACRLPGWSGPTDCLPSVTREALT
ncbi:hypothetical protein ACN2XU_12215 [Primorskyibacter sp. 2E107]|uniref:hypothetical protein n=1 Tax=Primorskyibacter sp. 2E107 TaxID=3403458 RepID=UPI003AF91645